MMFNDIISSAKEKNNYAFMKEWEDDDFSPGDKNLKIRKFYICNETRYNEFNFITTDSISINFEYEKFCSNEYYDIGVIFSNFNSQFLIAHANNSSLDRSKYMKAGNHKLKVVIPANLFSDVMVSIGMIILNSNDFQYYSPEIFTLKFQLSKKQSEYYSKFPKTTAPLLPVLKWELF